MKLTEHQQRIVEKNMGLVGKVIKDKVHGNGREGIFTYEDLFQIGCIGLCKAAATDKGGCFSTYAYRLIWNEICDALIKATRINQRETIVEVPEDIYSVHHQQADTLETIELSYILETAQRSAEGVTAKGIQCLVLSAKGYNSNDLGRIFDAKPAAIRMWMSKARKYLRAYPAMTSYTGS